MSAGAVKAGGVFVEIGADPAKFFAALKGVNKSIASIGKAMTTAGIRMSAIGAGAVGPIFASAAAFASVGSTLSDMSKRTGVAAESLSVLKFAAEQTGTDIAGTESALKKMQNAIFNAGNGSKEAADAFATVGLSVADLAGLSADQQLGKIADGLLAIKDPGTRAAASMQIFGKAGTDILPMLEGGSVGMEAFAAEAKRLGLIMDSQTAAKADSLGDAIDSVSASMKMAFIQIGAAVAPMLTELAHGLAAIASNAGRFITKNQQFVSTLLKGGAALFVVGGAITGVGHSLKGLSEGVTLIVKGFGLFSALASPVLLVAAGIGVAVVALYKFRNEIGNALGPVPSLVQQAAVAIGDAFGPAVADGTVVLGDLAKTATTTFNGIYEAVAAGDLSGAMDILWAGLVAGWLRGTEALMSYVDPWVTTFQDAFTIMGAEIYKGWDALWVSVGSALNTAGAYLMGAFDNIINPILAMWDKLEAGILKSWNYVQSFFKKGFDLKKENEKVDSEMSARARKREIERPGVNARVEKATKDNVAAEGAMIRRRDAVDANTQGAIAATERDAGNARRAADRRVATVAAEGALKSLVGGKAEMRVRDSQADDLLWQIKSATSVDQLAGVGGLGDQFSTMRDLGRLTSDQETMLSDALDKAAESITATAGAGAKGAAASKAEVAGTFSSTNLGGMGFGSSLAERTAKAAEDTAKGVKELVGQGGGKVAA
jgi:hypothetical protein